MSPDVRSTAEPWIMLPLWGARDAAAGRAVYFHHTCANAINDFLANTPDGEEVYARAVREFGLTLYSAAARGKAVFLDKTPRYYLMLPLLKRAFPEAKFVLLLRNPLAVLASLCETFNMGHFRWYEYALDWHVGHHTLAEGVRSSAENTKVIAYEDLVSRPESVMPGICEWIGVNYLPEMVSDFREASVPGRMGDPTGIKQYRGVSSASVDRWQEFFFSTYRRSVARNALAQLAETDLATLGYPMEILENQLRYRTPRGGFDLASRFDRVIGRLAHIADFRYLQARFRARQVGYQYAYGYFRKF